MRAGPTHVGMDRRAFPRRPGGGRRPHARGDGPTCLPPTTWRRTQAPRTWGWTATTSFVELLEPAGPTHVGMDRFFRARKLGRLCRPHARGDGPSRPGPRRLVREQAPRTWGWTGGSGAPAEAASAGPTHVGMDRQIHRSINTPRSRPHARGDGPIAYRKRKKEAKQAPRTWGWTVGGHRVVHRSCAGP